MKSRPARFATRSRCRCRQNALGRAASGSARCVADIPKLHGGHSRPKSVLLIAMSMSTARCAVALATAGERGQKSTSNL